MGEMTINEGRRCALPGCYVLIEPEPDGRPQRKYCTAAHRAVARQLRRESTHRSASAPPLPLNQQPDQPTAPLPLPPLAPVPVPVRRRRQLALATVRRCRAVAVLGSAGLLVSGGSLMVASAPADVSNALNAAGWQASGPNAEQHWADRAQITLASLDRQLQEVDRAEQAWQLLPTQRRVEPLPIPIRNLQARRVVLQQRRDSLADELSTYQRLQQTDQKLADTQHRIAALNDAGADGRRPTRASHTLADQRGQRDAAQQELLSLRDSVRKAMSSPLPRIPVDTPSITAQVADLIAHPERDKQSRQPDGSGTQQPNPLVIVPRTVEQPEKDDIANGAPPLPGRTRPELPPAPEVLAAPAVPGPVQAQPTPDPLLPPPNDVVPPANDVLPPPDKAVPPPNKVLPPPDKAVPPPNRVLPPPDKAVPPPNQPSGSDSGAGEPVNVAPAPTNLAASGSGDRSGSAQPKSDGELGGVTGSVERVADSANSEPDQASPSQGSSNQNAPSQSSASDNSSRHGSSATRSAPTQVANLPSASSGPSDTGSSHTHAQSSDQQKVSDAMRMRHEAISGDMGGLMSSAVKSGMRAKSGHSSGGDSSSGHHTSHSAHHSSHSGSSDSSSGSDDHDYSDLRESIMKSYGVDSDSSDHSSSHHSHSHHSDSDDSDSDHGDSDDSDSDGGSSGDWESAMSYAGDFD
jgi:hypothetical protein